MHWKLKAFVQNAIAALPVPLGNELYYAMQRRLGGFRRPDPWSRLEAGVAMADRAEGVGRPVEGARVFEVGTGHQLNLPIALWLCGARSITTVDLHRYLRAELVREDLARIAADPVRLRRIFGPRATTGTFVARFEALGRMRDLPLGEILARMDITYSAPADAAARPEGDGAFDLHTSYTVLEHIPPAVLTAIFAEGRRILSPDGVFIHCIDFTDHFAHGDATIPSVNFLQFTEEEWDRLAGNRFMYHNRLRLDEFEALVREMGLTAPRIDHIIDEKAFRWLEGEHPPLAPRFAGKPAAINAARNAWLVATPR